jgi:hypothetical protein
VAPCAFDFAPLELPALRDYRLRVDCYTVPGFAGYEATRRRLLRGADGVLFVADARPEMAAANIESWQALDRLLRAAERVDAWPVPVVLVANKQDEPGAQDAGALAERLRGSGARRRLLARVDATASTGTNVLAAFREAVLAGAKRALDPLEMLGEVVGEAPTPSADDATFLDALGAQFGGLDHGVPVADVVAGRAVSFAGEDAAPLRSEPDASVRPARDAETDGRRDGALGRLLIDVAHGCASATDDDGAVRTALIQLVMNLDAVSGWIGLPHVQDGEHVYDVMGRARDAHAVAEAAHALGFGLDGEGAVPVGAAATAGFPGGAAGGRGLFLQFPIGGGEPGWMLLVGSSDRGLPAEAEAALRTGGAILGLTVARLRAHEQLRALNRALENKVADRTTQLEREKVGLEDRVRARTRELDKARRAALETERMLFDRGRSEGVLQLAAGVAHDLNNPLSAVSVNLKFALELLREAEAAGAVDAEWIEDLRAAVTEAAGEAETAARRVRSLFGRDVAATRRAAVRTPVRQAVLEAVSHFRQVHPDALLPEVGGPADVLAGVQPTELTRWVFRTLSAVAGAARAPALIDVEPGPPGPVLSIRLEAPPATGAALGLESLAAEVAVAGGVLKTELAARSCRLRLELPPASGARGSGKLWERSA